MQRLHTAARQLHAALLDSISMNSFCQAGRVPLQVGPLSAYQALECTTALVCQLSATSLVRLNVILCRTVHAMLQMLS